MKKTFSLLLGIFLILNFTMIGCTADTSDAWKNNTGEINLTDLTVTGNGVSVDGSQINITQGGDFTVIGTLTDGMIYVNTEEKVKLRLSGASITNSDGPAIFFDNTEKALITITEDTENYLADGKDYSVEDADAALFSNDDLEIKGNGTLTVKGNYKHGIAGDDDVSIETGVITVNSYEHGIKANDTLSITGGTISITTETGKGMKAELEVIIDDGDIDITSKDEGIESKGTLTINGGDINITTDEDGINTGNSSTETTEQNDMMQKPANGEQTSQMRGERPAMPQGEMSQGGKMPQGEMQTPPEGFDGQTPPEMPQGEMPEGKMPQGGMQTPPEGFDGQTPPEMPQGEMPQGEMTQGKGGGRGGMGGGMPGGHVDEETAAAHAITITGGSIYINTKCDGIDSNGNLTISGGTVIIDGPIMNGNGPLDSQGSFTISGGTVVTTSSAGMLQFPSGDGNQNIIRVNFSETQSSGSTVSLADSDGNELISVTPENEYQVFVFSSANIKSGSEYVVSVNGEEKERFTATDGTSSAGQGGGRGFGGGMGGMQGGMPGGRGNHGGDKVTVKVNGQEIKFDTDPVIKNDTTLVGYRAIMEALGAEVSWDEATQTVTATKDDTVIILTIGSLDADVNGKKHTLLKEPEIIGDSTMVPVRFISEQLGMNVGWDEAANLVTVDSQ